MSHVTKFFPWKARPLVSPTILYSFSLWSAAKATIRELTNLKVVESEVDKRTGESHVFCIGVKLDEIL